MNEKNKKAKKGKLKIKKDKKELGITKKPLKEIVLDESALEKAIGFISKKQSSLEEDSNTFDNASVFLEFNTLKNIRKKPSLELVAEEQQKPVFFSQTPSLIPKDSEQPVYSGKTEDKESPIYSLTEKISVDNSTSHKTQEERRKVFFFEPEIKIEEANFERIGFEEKNNIKDYEEKNNEKYKIKRKDVF
jgi:hypothetical protein